MPAFQRRYTDFACSIIAGRAIKNEYIALATLGLTGLAVTMSMGGKKEAPAPSGAKPTLQQIKETVNIGAGSRYVVVVVFGSAVELTAFMSPARRSSCT